MASRKIFNIPSESDMKESDGDQIKKFSKFKTFQMNKDDSLKPQPPPTRTTKSFVESKPDTGGLTTSTSTFRSSNNVSRSAVSKSVTSSSDAVSTSSSSTASLSSSLKSTTTTAATSSSSNPIPSAVPSVSKPASLNSIIVNYRQRGNPVLKHIRNVPWEYGSIIPDYVMGNANCALFLSLRYHQLHPEYLHNRLKELGKGYDLRVLLVQVDVKESHALLKDLAKICILADMTLMLAFTAEEVGRYLEAYKVYENKPAEALMERTETDFVSQLTECLTTVKSVNKTDCMTLLTAFKSMNGIINASKQDIACCAGFGPQKAQRLYDVFNEPFLKCRKQQRDGKATNTEHSPAKKAR